jgi:hypothetical protein
VLARQTPAHRVLGLAHRNHRRCSIASRRWTRADLGPAGWRCCQSSAQRDRCHRLGMWATQNSPNSNRIWLPLATDGWDAKAVPCQSVLLRLASRTARPSAVVRRMVSWAGCRSSHRTQNSLGPSWPLPPSVAARRTIIIISGAKRLQVRMYLRSPRPVGAR